MLTKEDLQAISDIMDTKLDPIKEQLEEIDTAIGMLAEWADNVAIITKVPFASGQTQIQ